MNPTLTGSAAPSWRRSPRRLRGTDVPLHATGADAAAHGLRDVAAPGDRARSAIDKLNRKRGRA